MSDEIAYTYAVQMAQFLKASYEDGAGSALENPAFAVIIQKLCLPDLSTFIFVFLVKRNMSTEEGLSYARSKFTLTDEEIRLLCECCMEEVDDDFGLQAAYCQGKFVDPQETRLAVHILAFGLSKLAILPFRLGRHAREHGMVTANTPTFAPSLRFLMACVYVPPDKHDDAQYLKARAASLRTEFGTTDDVINSAVVFVRFVVLGGRLLPNFENILAKTRRNCEWTEQIWGFGTKHGVFNGFYVGQKKTYNYWNKENKLRKVTSTVVDLVKTGIKIATENTTGPQYYEVVPFKDCRHQLRIHKTDELDAPAVIIC